MKHLLKLKKLPQHFLIMKESMSLLLDLRTSKTTII